MSESVDIRITESLDRDDWDRFVNSNSRATVFQTSNMAEVYKRTTKYEPVLIAAVNERTDEVLATLLVVIKKEKNGFLGSFSTHSSIRGGPIFDDSQTGITAASELIKYYDKEIRKKALYTRIYNLYDDVHQFSSVLCNHNYKFEKHLNYLIDLNRPKDKIWQDMNRSRRKRINKAKKEGVIVEEVDSDSLIPVVYNLIRGTYINAKLPLLDITLLKSTFAILYPKNMIKVFMAKYNEEYIAAQVRLLYNGVIYAWYSGVSQNSLKLNSIPLLIWHVLEWGSENGYHTFDFGGAGTTNEMQGIKDFKSQFGGNLVNYGRYTKIHQPKKLWFSEKMFKVYQKLIIR